MEILNCYAIVNEILMWWELDGSFEYIALYVQHKLTLDIGKIEFIAFCEWIPSKL